MFIILPNSMHLILKEEKAMATSTRIPTTTTVELERRKRRFKKRFAIILLILILTYNLFSLWESFIYPEEAYQLLEELPEKTIIKNEKRIDFSKVPERLSVSIPNGNAKTVYDNISISYSHTVSDDSPIVKYSMKGIQLLFGYSNPEITVTLDKDYNIVNINRNFSNVKYTVIYWIIRELDVIIIATIIAAIIAFACRMRI